jgi:hypothetical protein
MKRVATLAAATILVLTGLILPVQAATPAQSPS